ncbi:ATP-binding protein [Chakrabartyella piscis]|uniref:ATP-binding protein n=1 Tax=Chakrabartyella piscis TaxID=2918914 RepID=UPI002958A2D1|nr:ATP-binding protein [Chakrabartyella piscis]
MRYNELILYKNLSTQSVLQDMDFIIENVGIKDATELKPLLFDCIHKILEVSDARGFSGDLWKTYLTYLLVADENTYSKSCEIVGNVEGSINKATLHDLQIIKEYFDYDLQTLGNRLGVGAISLLYGYVPVKSSKKLFNTRIRDRICNLSKELESQDDVAAFKDTLTHFYKEYGVGQIGLHKAFRVNHIQHKTTIEPITNITHVHLDDLVGYEIPKQRLIDNTEAFIKGKKSNNCLLFGDAGTGKSTCIKAILNQYYGDGLRIIEVYKHQFQYLNDVIAQVKNRNYKFIIYMDDLSFEEFEVEYKYLKAIIEGGLEKKPANVLIYATSNRRHLIREEFGDRQGMKEDLHPTDTVQEKQSLSARFGEPIYFRQPNPEEFKEIVRVLANRNHITMEDDQLMDTLNKWQMSRGGKSGRAAQQFIDHLLGTVTE